uniref:Major facilitator superfamily (MFS) profile domain-containing protein n=1 Tax=Arcella intermedia TaxID=1963864 RepID=A0A6B2L399_9EUKA
MPDPPEDQVANSTSIFLMIFLNFLSNVVFSIVLPTLPNFLERVDAPKYLNGWAVAVNSLGTFLASPVFGWWADKRNFREVFFISLVLMFASNLWYALCKDKYQLFAARFIVGVAAANYAPANSYLSYATSSADRAKIMTWNAASTVLGFICGPAFSLLTSLPALSFTAHIGNYELDFDAETAPGWVSAFFALCGILCLIPFKEVKKLQTAATVNIPKAITNTSIRSFRSLSMVGKTRIPMKGVLICLFFTFAFTTAFTIFETTGPLYTYDAFQYNDFSNSLLFLAISIGSLVALAALQGLLYFVPDERVLLVTFGLLLTSGLAVLSDYQNGHVSLPRFFGGIALVAVGYADGQALLLALFSKLLEEQEQGMMMGWLSSSGSIARMICPVSASYVYHSFGANYIFLCCAALCFVATMGVLFGWREVDTTKSAPQLVPPTTA